MSSDNLGNQPDTGDLPQYVLTSDLLYADDTVLIGTDAAVLQRHMHLISAVGQAYGLELNVDKTVLLRIRHNGQIASEDGLSIKAVEKAVYLGAF